MRFYYENSCGDTGHFSEKDIIKAIYTAWNIEAYLYIATPMDKDKEDIKLIFAPWEDNEVNNEWLKEYGYYMIDGEIEREIRKIDTNEIIKYDWSEVKQLV